MLFCESCRVKKNWPCLPGYPDIGWKSDAVCEVCKSSGGCHDVPASRLKPDKDKTVEEKLVADAMERGYRVKAEGLAVWNLNGTLDYTLTKELKTVFVYEDNEIIWYSTYYLRLKIQQVCEDVKRRERDSQKRRLGFG